MILRATPEFRAAVDRKPRYGSPCNGCGACCMATLCNLAQFVFRQPPVGRCPALTRKEDGTYGCGLVEKSKSPRREAALMLIGAGDGCDARFNGEPRDEEFSSRLDRRDEANKAARTAALAAWSGA